MTRAPQRREEDGTLRLQSIGLLFAAIALAVAPAARAACPPGDTCVYVDATACAGVEDECENPGPGTGTEMDPYCCLQDGLDNALTGDTLEELGVSNFDEYAQFLTNVVSSGRGPGQRELYVRGAATEQSSITVTS